MLPIFTRFSKADIPNAPDWISVILDPLNIFCETVVNLLNKNLKIGQNVQGMIYSTSFTTPSDVGLAHNPWIVFNYSGNGTPSCVLIGQVTLSNGDPINDPILVKQWRLNQNKSPYQIEIVDLYNLMNNATYNITFLVL